MLRASRTTVRNARGSVEQTAGQECDTSDGPARTQQLGWRYEAVACQTGSVLTPMVSPYVSCDPDDAYQDPLAQQILSGLYSNLLLSWNILFPPILTNAQMEDRKNYNTRMFAQRNEGHEFNAVLTDAERMAIIEYLKTP